MKRLLFLVAFYLYSVMAFSQNLLVKKNYHLDDKGKKTKNVSEEYQYTLVNNEEIKNGYYKEYTFDNLLAATGFYLNDEKTGEWKSYSYGEVEWIAHYENNEKHGIYEKYEDNQLVLAGNYTNGLMDGTWTSFVKGFKAEVKNYSMGELNGSYELYDGKKQLVTTGSYKANVKNGVWTNYSNGKKELEMEILGDMVNYKAYNEGYLSREGQLVNNKREGSWKAYYPEGQTLNILNYKNNMLVDTCISYYPQGQVLSKKVYKDNEFSSQIVYYENGNTLMKYVIEGSLNYRFFYDKQNNVVEKLTTLNGKIIKHQFYDTLGNALPTEPFADGTGAILYYNKGILIEKRTFVNNDLNGERCIYYPNGKIAKKADYKNGEIAASGWQLFDTTGVLIDNSCYDDLGLIDVTLLEKNKKLAYCLNVSGYTVGSDLDNHEKYQQSASYVGGNNEMYKFISENIVYPRILLENNIQGKVYILFEVNEFGTVENVRKSRAGEEQSKQFYEEAKRVISLFPAWNPALAFGLPARGRFIIPISFKIN